MGDLLSLSSAVISDCGLYRYRLKRVWGSGRALCFIMLNPSTADATADDPTIRRCIGFAKQWGYAGITIGNLFALRATDPKALRSARDPIGPDNDDHLSRMARGEDSVVCAWGAGGDFLGRGDAVTQMLRSIGVLAACLGITRSGAPRHPLYLPKIAQVLPYHSDPIAPSEPRR